MGIERHFMNDHCGTFERADREAKNLCSRITRLLANDGHAGDRFGELTKVVICMTPRSGSSYLSSILANNGVGTFQEHFRVVNDALENLCEERKLDSVEQWVADRIRTLSAGGVYGFKCDWQQFVPLYYLGPYDHFFRDAKFVYLTRNDVMAQAVSRYISTETGYFHSVNADKAHTLDDDIALDFDQLKGHLERLITMQGCWEHFFADEGISPLRISYEAIEEDAENVVRRVASFAGINLPPSLELETEYKKVRTARNDVIRAEAIAEARSRRIKLSEILSKKSESPGLRDSPSSPR